MAERKPDVFLQLGDMVYNDSATRSAVETRANGDEETAKDFIGALEDGSTGSWLRGHPFLDGLLFYLG